MPLTPQEFVDKWSVAELKERASYQQHFLDVCEVLEQPKPAEYDPEGTEYTFERGLQKTSGAQGFADVWKRGCFAIEYKGKGKDLAAAYRQLLEYREALENPPLLIVCDIDNWEIHTNFPNTQKRIYRFTNADILRPDIRRTLTCIFEAPEMLHPNRVAEQVTKEAAAVFKDIADELRAWETDPERIARFLTKLVFCLFAEDVGLLPPGPTGDEGVFTHIVRESRRNPAHFVHYTQELFEAMADGGTVLMRDVRYFDGLLFEDTHVEPLQVEALAALEKACKLDWASVEPAIFGTLFERSLDPAKRAQLGAHYTSRDDIMLIVEPVLMQPLRREWAALQEQARPVRAAYEKAETRRTRQNRLNELSALRERMLHRLRTVTVLDPACGSGNFLYVALQLLKDLEKEVITHPLWEGLSLALPEVHPRQLHGIEISPIAHALASIVVWIGFIQWRRDNAYVSYSEPILEPLHNIELKDAILAYDEDGNPVEPEWPAVDVIVSNPPFLGGNKIRQELGDYVDDLFALYEGRVPAFADLVCYWWEKARAAVEQDKAKRVGLLATNSIRGGANREVLKRIKQTGDIFMAWSDRPWILEGAAVRVSMVGFDRGIQTDRTLDGLNVSTINPDLTASVDVTDARQLPENVGIQYEGTKKGAAFDIPDELAQQMLQIPPRLNNGRSNSDVIHPWVNGSDIVRRPRHMWVIDFGVDMPLEEAMLYEAPFNFVEQHVKPKYGESRKMWWIHERTRPEMREALAPHSRFIGTARVSKHRLFVWLPRTTIPDSATIAFARDDDYFFGVLHSYLHELWSLRTCTWLGKGNDPRYTPTTTFETFPFPWPPGKEPEDHPAYKAVSTAAKQLHEERDAWLNPPGVPEARLKQRTLTNLYNALTVYRGQDTIKVQPDAADFAPRLDALHRALDCAVCDAYGWAHDILSDDEEILRRLLALNLERAAQP